MWWGHPSFSIIPSESKVGYHTHVRQFPGYVIRRLANHSASSGTPHLQGSLFKPFFSLGGIQALAKPFQPLLFFIQPLFHRNEKSRGGKGADPEERRNIDLTLKDAHLSRTQVLSFFFSSKTDPAPLQNPPRDNGLTGLATTTTSSLSTPGITPGPGPLPSHPPPAEHWLLSTSPPVGQSLHIPRAYRCGNGGTRDHC